MKDSLEYRKLKLEHARVYAARLDLEFQQEDHLSRAERLKPLIAIQIAKEEELEAKLKEEEQS